MESRMSGNSRTTNNNYLFMKKMYNQPQTEILSVNTEYMMQDLTVSINEGGGGGGTAGAPARRSVAPSVPGAGL